MNFKKENFLLYMGAGIFSCTSIIYSIINYNYPHLIQSSEKFGNFNNVFLVLISVLIIAPIFEEITFRGIFTSKKLYIYCFYLGSIILILITKNYYLFLLLILHYLMLIFKQNKSKITFFSVSLLFALIHYNTDDFVNIYSVIPVFFQFSIGLLLIWITINYGLKYSVLSHFIINLIIILPIIILLQTPDIKIKEVKYKKNRFTWQKTPIFGNSKFSFSPNKVVVQRLTIEQFTKLFNNKELEELKINDSLKYFRYDITIESTSDENLKPAEIKQILLKYQLAEE